MGQIGKNNDAKTLWAIIIIALFVRLIPAIISDNINHPDEIFQVMEQSHRIVYDYGIIPWEYRHDVRSWLVPGIMAVLLYPVKLLGLNQPDQYIPAIKVILAFISLAMVLAAYFLGKKLHSSKAGLLAALFTAIWYEMIYFSIHPLSDVWAGYFLIGAVAFGLYDDKNRNIILSAVLTVLAVAVRINLAPAAAAVALLLLIRFDKPARVVYVVIGLISLIAVGIFDWITLGGPFISYINYFGFDKEFYMAGPFGSAFSTEYILFLGFSSFFLYWVFFIGGFLSAKNARFLITVIIILLISHILIPAKEHEIDYRTVFAVIPLVLITGAIFVTNIRDKLGPEKIFNTIIIFIVITVSIFGAWAKLPGQEKVYEGKIYEVYNRSIFYRDPHLQSYRYLHDSENLRAVFDASDMWFRSGGFYYLHRDVPLYYRINRPPAPQYISHLITRDEIRDLRYYMKETSFNGINIYYREASSTDFTTDPDYDMNIYQPGID